MIESVSSAASTPSPGGVIDVVSAFSIRYVVSGKRPQPMSAKSGPIVAIDF